MHYYLPTRRARLLRCRSTYYAYHPRWARCCLFITTWVYRRLPLPTHLTALVPGLIFCLTRYHVNDATHTALLLGYHLSLPPTHYSYHIAVLRSGDMADTAARTPTYARCKARCSRTWRRSSAPLPAPHHVPVAIISPQRNATYRLRCCFRFLARYHLTRIFCACRTLQRAATLPISPPALSCLQVHRGSAIATAPFHAVYHLYRTCLLLHHRYRVLRDGATVPHIRRLLRQLRAMPSHRVDLYRLPAELRYLQPTTTVCLPNIAAYHLHIPCRLSCSTPSALPCCLFFSHPAALLLIYSSMTTMPRQSAVNSL